MKLADDNAYRAVDLIPLKSDSVLAVYANLLRIAQLSMEFLEAPTRWVAKTVSQRGRVEHLIDQRGSFLV